MGADMKWIVDSMESIIPKYTKIVRIFQLKGMTRPQARILLLLQNEGPLSVSEIADSLEMADSNVSYICSKLEKSGFLVRTRQENDQRVVKVSVRREMIPKIQHIQKNMTNLNEQVFERVSEEDLESIQEGLTKLDVFLESILQSNFFHGRKQHHKERMTEE